MTKKLIYALTLISLAAISCGTLASLPTQPTAPVPHVTAVIPAVSANVETVTKDETNLQFIVTAPLHVRTCASINCDVIAYLVAGDSVAVKWSVAGPGCAGADWYAIEWQGWTGFICSLYVEER